MPKIKQPQASASANQLISSRFTGGNGSFAFSGQLTGGRASATLVNPVTFNSTPRVGPPALSNLSSGTIPLSAAEFPLELAVAAKGLSVLSEAFEKAQRRKQEDDEFEEDLLVDSLVTDDRKSIELFKKENKRNPRVDATSDYLKTFFNSQVETLEKNRENLSDRGFKTLEALLNANRVNNIAEVEEITAAARSNKFARDINKQIDKAVDVIKTSSHPAEDLNWEKGRLLSMIDAAEEKDIITPAMAERKREHIDKLVPADVATYFAGIKGMTDQARSILEDSTLDLTVEGRIEKIANSTDAFRSQRDQRDAKFLVEKTLFDAMNSGVAPGYISDEEAQANLSEADFKDYKEFRPKAIEVGVAKARMMGIPLFPKRDPETGEIVGESITGIVEELTSLDEGKTPTRADAFFQKGLAEAAKAAKELLTDAPFISSMGNPGIRASFDLAHNSEGVEQQKLFHAAFKESLDFQENELSVPRHATTVMDDQAAITRAGLLGLGSPEQYVEAAKGVFEHFGDEAGLVAFRQMSQLTGLAKIPLAYQVLGLKSGDIKAQKTIIQALKLDHDNVRSATKNTLKFIRDEVVGNETLINFREVLRQTGVSQEAYGQDLEDVLYQVAVFEHSQAGSSLTEGVVGETVENAAQLLISSEYDFIKVKNSTIMFQKSDDNLSKKDYRMVQDGASKILDPDFFDVDQLSNRVFGDNVNFATHADMREAKRDWLENNAFLRSTPESDAVVLMFHSDDTDEDFMWNDRNELPITFTPKELIDFGIARPDLPELLSL